MTARFAQGLTGGAMPTSAPAKQPRIIEFEGRRIEISHDATDDEITEILSTSRSTGPITDPELLRQLEGGPVTNPELLRQLESAPWDTSPGALPRNPKDISFDDLIPQRGKDISFDDLITKQAAPSGGIIEVELPDGRIAEFPARTSREVMRCALQRHFGSKPKQPDHVDTIMGGPKPASAEGASAPTDDGFMGTLLSALGYADRTGANLVRGVRRGVANIVGLPVDLVNASPVLVGAEPFSKGPLFGSNSIDRALSGYGAIPEPQADDIVHRGVRRVGEEVGAAAVPAAAALGTAARVGVEGARQLPSLARMFVEPAAVNPARFVGKETAAAVAAGLGATGGRE
jgi:hypothetical protein